ncbi:MAG: hypothetical protein JO076_16695 [Verrucomicrobia bacterium]|nr:hypothetical protein [Verrucomicrobiota bacterium]
MSDETSPGLSEEQKELHERRLFLQGIGKWSGAAIAAVVFGGAWLATAPEVQAASWFNSWGPRGGWINRWGPRRGGWINRWGPRRGGWFNRRGPRRGGWINRW